MEIIHLVEHSDLSIRKTCAELDVARSTFYRWYSRYQEEGFDGLMDRQPEPRQFWNRIPPPVSDQIVALALAHPEKSPRQIAWLFTDQQGYFVSESSVYRILKGFDLVQSPVFQMVSAREKFEKPTQRVHELWQTDFTQFKVFNHWGWYPGLRLGQATFPRSWMTTPATSLPGGFPAAWGRMTLKRP